MTNRNWLAPFQAEDFAGLYGTPIAKWKLDELAKIADAANAIIRQMVEASPRVYSAEGFESFWSKHKDPASDRAGYVVAIEPLKGEG